MALTDQLLAGWHLDEATASPTWADVLTTNPMTAVGTITSVAGVSGGAASGFSAGNYLDLPSAIIPPGAFSVSLWVYLTATSPNLFFWSQGQSGFPAKQFFELINARGVISLRFFIDGNAGATFSVTPTLNVWHNLIGTFDGTTAKLFYDNVLRATAVTSFVATGNNNNRLGVDTDGGESAGGASIDEVYLWSRALTDGGVSLGQVAGGDVSDLFGPLRSYPFVQDYCQPFLGLK